MKPQIKRVSASARKPNDEHLPQITELNCPTKEKYQMIIPDWAKDEYSKISKKMDSYFTAKK